MRVGVFTEHGVLDGALVCPPSEPLEGAAPINAVQERTFATDPPNFERLQAEHRGFEAALRSLGVETYRPPRVTSPFQLFCRDPGFVVGRRFFLSAMAKPVRRAETPAFERWLGEHGIEAIEGSPEPLEGGDVIVDAPVLLVGIGERTTAAAAAWLAETTAPEWRVIPIELAEGVLHLDCVLALVAPETMIYCPELIRSGRRELEQRYPRRIRISAEQSFDMACNVLTVGSTVLVESRQTDLVEGLQKLGLTPRALDGTEMRKFGGLFRCAVCPLSRRAEG